MTDNEGDSGIDPSERDLVSRLGEDPATVGSMIGHLYRGEVTRATEWRKRLDQTTNWAVILVAAILTWAFSSRDNPHYVILIGMLGVTAFLLIEAHRFQEYDIWRTRVRLLQEHVFGSLLVQERVSGGDWQTQLGESLRSPRITVPIWRAIGHRLRRIYLALLAILGAAWTARITVFQPEESWRQTASLPGLSGEIVVAIVVAFYVVVVVAEILSVRGGEIREVEE